MTSQTDPRSIPELALLGARCYGEAPAIVDGTVCLTFTEVRDRMLAVAASLIECGIAPGDRVALWAPNSAVWISAALGILASAAQLVPLNTRFTAREVAQVCRTVDPALLLVANGFMGRDHLAELRSESPELGVTNNAVQLPLPGEEHRPEWDAFLSRGSKVGPDAPLARIASIGPDDVSDVMLTSGTTGAPKGVMLRHGATLRAYRTLNDSYDVRQGDRMIVGLPFFHCFGYKAGWMLNLLGGATTYPLAVFDPEGLLEMIDRHRITHLPGSPTMFQPLLDHPRRFNYDLSSLRVALIGGAFIPVELVRRLKEEIGIERVLAGYGLTENHALISVSTPEDSPELVATTVGKVIDGLEVITVDDEGRPLPHGQQGELLVRGYLHMSGYYGDPEATEGAYLNGWLRTGDIGSVDEKGYVRITDRKKDIYITGGFNVAPAEVENVLCACPKISQVAVVGVPDDRMGEVGAAFVVPAAGAAITPEEVIAYAQSRLANFKIPRYVEIIASLPTNATGKVRKDELRARHAAAQRAR